MLKNVNSCDSMNDTLISILFCPQPLHLTKIMMKKWGRGEDRHNFKSKIKELEILAKT